MKSGDEFIVAHRMNVDCSKEGRISPINAI